MRFPAHLAKEELTELRWSMRAYTISKLLTTRNIKLNVPGGLGSV